MIANCPSCGTHYKHEPPKIKVRARCGRCDTTLDLARFRPYRIVPDRPPTADEAARAALYAPIGLDHPNLATSIAVNAAQPAAAPPAPARVSEPAPVPQESRPAPDLVGYDTPAAASGGAAEFALSVAAASIAGTTVSWSMGGTTVAGATTGAAIGAVGWWAWRRWTSPN